MCRPEKVGGLLDVCATILAGEDELAIHDVLVHAGGSLELVASLPHCCSHMSMNVEFDGMLKKAGVEVEDVTGVCLMSWWVLEEQGHLMVCNSLLGKIIVNDEGCRILPCQ